MTDMKFAWKPSADINGNPAENYTIHWFPQGSDFPPEVHTVSASALTVDSKGFLNLTLPVAPDVYQAYVTAWDAEGHESPPSNAVVAFVDTTCGDLQPSYGCKVYDENNNLLRSGEGSECKINAPDEAKVFGTDGPDRIFGPWQAEWESWGMPQPASLYRFHGKGGDDILCPGAAITVNPTSPDQRINGVNCGDGNDVVGAAPGSTVIECGPGDDTVYLGSGNTNAVDKEGQNTFRGGPGNQTIEGNPFGWDNINGGSGYDKCKVSPGDDVSGCEVLQPQSSLPNLKPKNIARA